MLNRSQVAEMYRSRKNISIRILPNAEMTLRNAEDIRIKEGADFGVVFDTNPLDVKTKEDLQRVWAEFPNVLLVDHHGPNFRPMPIGKEETTTQILIDEHLGNLDSELSRWLRSGKTGLAFTNVQNYDPDGILSYSCLRDPALCLENAELLKGAAWFTDHALFGGRDYGKDAQGNTLSTAEKFGFTLLQKAVEMNEVLVEETLAEWQLHPDRDSIASVFSGEGAVYGPETLSRVFNQMTGDLQQLLAHPSYYLSDAFSRPWRRYLRRVVTAERQVRKEMTGDGLVAFYSYSERPDFTYPVTCWLACGAPAPLAPETPLMLAHSQRSNQCVLSVPYSTQRDHELAWNLVPVMEAANSWEEISGTEGRWGGRGSVVFRFTPSEEYVVTPEGLLQLTHVLFKQSKISCAK